MGNNRNRYQAMQTLITRVLLANLALFVLYLIVAASAIIWLKVIFVIFRAKINYQKLCLTFNSRCDIIYV